MGVRLGGEADPGDVPGGDDMGLGADEAPRPSIVALRGSGVPPGVGIAFGPEPLEDPDMSAPGEMDRVPDAFGGAAAGSDAETGGRGGGGVRGGGRSESVVSSWVSNDLPASTLVFISLSMTTRDGSSILMNLTPMPAGRSPLDAPASRFHTMRPTPAMTAWSLESRISNLSRVPGGKGFAVLMKMPPRLTSCAWFSMNSSTVALL